MATMLALAFSGQAQEVRRLVTEMRIGNAAAYPGQAMWGDFEYDIGLNTADPAETGQYAWPNGEPVPFEVTYHAAGQYAEMQVGDGRAIRYDMRAGPLSGGALVDLHFGGRASAIGSWVEVKELEMLVEGEETWVGLPVVFKVLPADGYKSQVLRGLALSAGYRLRGQVTMRWDPLQLPPQRGHLAVQMSFVEWQMDVDTDVNRDGVINAADDDQEDQWTVARGAFMPVNEWMNGHVDLVSTDTITKLAQVVIQPVGVLPAGWRVVLRLDGNTAITLTTTHQDATGSPWQFGNGDELPSEWLTTDPLKLYAAANNDLSAFANKLESIAKVVVELRDDADHVRATDTVALQIAPIILAWNSLPLERLYCTPEFPPNICDPLQRVQYDHPSAWVQDYMELGTCRLATSRTVDVVMDLDHRYDRPGFCPAIYDYIDESLRLEAWYATPPQSPLQYWHKTTWRNDGNGGNIEVFPPYVDSAGKYYRYGRVVMLEPTAVLPQIEAQGLQDPVTLDLDWLAIGHIDEVFCFLTDLQVLVVDPGRAWEAVIEMVNNPAWNTTIRLGKNEQYADALTTVTDDINFFFSQTMPLEGFLDVSDSVFHVSIGDYEPGNFLLIDREVIKVVGVQSTGNGNNLQVLRGQAFGNSGGQHLAGAKIRKLSKEFTLNVYKVGNEDSFDLRLEDHRVTLQQKLNKVINFTSIPIVFGDRIVDGLNVGQRAVTANMVNCVVDGNTIYATDPGHLRFKQLFQSFVSRTVQFIDGATAWEYHRNGGGLHCGSNAKRIAPPDVWWTFTEYNTWGTTP